jgi:dolichol-phosphate mannosyltransferase
MSDTLIVIPTYNEKENVRDIVRAIFQHSSDVDILFVDDNSPDGTGRLIDEMCASDPRVHILHRTEKAGLGRAYIAGFKWALNKSYEFIFEMDCDFSHDPAAIPEFRKAAAGADLALGTRYKGGVRVINWPLHRLFLSKGAAVYVHSVTGMPFTDPTGGFKCYRRGVLESIELDRIRSNGYSFQIEMTHHAWMRGFKIVEVPITFVERRSGASKMSSEIVHEALLMVWKLWLRAGLRRRPPAEAHPRSIAARSAAGVLP